jgi:hypothetical protein
MFIKILCFILFLSVASANVELNVQDKAYFKNIANTFYSGKYEKALKELNSLYYLLKEKKELTKENLGLIFYWRGVNFKRLQDYPNAIKNFELAKKIKFIPDDLHYELAQSLFVSNKLKEAREEFKQSIQRNIKKAVSMYYVGYISYELKEYNKAYTFLKGVEKINSAEAREVKQPAAFILGDIYLELAQRESDVFSSVKKNVIPQYEMAYDIDSETNLAQKILEKKMELLKRYDLALFQFRNGRPAAYPPHLLRASAEVGIDSNVTFSPNDTTIDKSKQSSIFGKTGAFGKYSFFVDDSVSLSPEIGLSYVRYMNRQPEIFRNDNLVILLGLRNSFEYSLFKKSTSLLIDAEYTDVQRDVHAENQLDFNSRAHAFTLGERIIWSKSNEITLRIKQKTTDSYLDNSDSKSTSLSFDQILSFPQATVLIYIGYDVLRMKDDVFDTNSITSRCDVIFPAFKNLFEPSFGLMMSFVDPINNRQERGKEMLINPNLRLSKNLSRNLKGHLKFDYQENRSRDEENFSYRKMISSIELEYVY